MLKVNPRHAPPPPTAGLDASALPTTSLDAAEVVEGVIEGPPADHPAVVGGEGDTEVEADQRIEEAVPAGPERRPISVREAAPPAMRGAPPGLERATVLAQLQASVRRAIRLSRVTVHLRPPDLGTIRIAVESRQGRLSAHIHATHPGVGAWLQSNALTLRSGLAESGLTFQDFSFTSAGGRDGRELPGERAEPQPEPERRQADGGSAEGPSREAGIMRLHSGTVDWRA